MVKKKEETDLKQFIARQNTIPAPQEEELQHPYSEYWIKAVIGILLSRRVRPTYGGNPNRTDINRVCKEANFSQHLFEDTARFLIKSEVIIPNNTFHVEYYQEGKNFIAFLTHDFKKIQSAAQETFLDFVQDYTGFRTWRSTFAHNSGLIEFLILFFRCFRGLALPSDEIGKVFLEFSRLPENILNFLMKEQGIKDKGLYNWESWLDEKGQQAILSALYVMRWIYGSEQKKKNWIYLNSLGQILLGLRQAPALPPSCTDFKVLSNFCILAGCDLPVKTLVTLFRYCQIIRIDRIIEFRLDKKVLQEVPSKPPARQELLKVLKELEPLPSTIKTFLEDKTQIEINGMLEVSYCSAIVKPEHPRMLQVIRQHPRLKGYLTSQSPPGYLLIKYGSRADNFIRKCREYGFDVKFLSS